MRRLSSSPSSTSWPSLPRCGSAGDAGRLAAEGHPQLAEQRQGQVERERLARLRHTPAVTLDGQKIELLANIEMPEDADAALQAGAVGVGLFRSEFLFLNRPDLPGEEEQFKALAGVVKSMAGRPVTVRTLDVGADKLGSAVGLKPGPKVGALIAEVERWWIAGDFAADRAACLAELERIAKAP